MSLTRKLSLTLVALIIVGFTVTVLPRMRTAQANAPQTPPPIPIRHSNGKIAFEATRDASTEIYVMNTDGSGQTRVTNTAGEEQQPVWAPDGNRIAFASTGAGGANLYDICVVNADGTGFTNLTNQQVDAVDPAWSPDGSKIAFTNFFVGSGIYVINADGSGLLNLTSDATNDERPLWSPDGSRIAFISRRNGNREIYVMNADGSGQTNLTNNPANDGGEGFVWSPDGNKIAFISRRDGGPDIYSMNADGSNVQRLTNTADNLDLDWSPDGTRISFTSGRHSVDTLPNLRIRGDIYVMNADGSSQTRVTNDPNSDFIPKWSPDSSQLAWRYRTSQTPSGFNDEIYTMASGGGVVSNLTATLSSEGNFSWGYYTTQPEDPNFNTQTGVNSSVQLGSVSLTFNEVSSPGNTSATPIDPSTAGALPNNYVLPSSSIAFEINTTAAYTGPITVCFNTPSITDPAEFASLRVLHGEGGVLVDRTILSPDSPSPDFGTKTICARVSSLSPFVIARLAPPPPPPAPTYNIRTLYDTTKAHKSGSTVPIKIQVYNEDGTNASSSSLIVNAVSLTRVSSNTTSEVEDAGNANPDNNFRYDSGSYIFNLKTKGLASGTYRLGFKVGNGNTVYTVPFQVK